MNWKPGTGANANRTLRLMRKGQTQANAKYGTGGRLKYKPSTTVTLPKLKCLEQCDDDPR